ncbi:MAG TPA: flagellar motor switch protein FliM [Thermodesulfovibrionales bacterium]|jgi:flagellar motor switch protein FliM|nr:flagellar motor switch protein FliM [Thermodesulfovibrionales bacterium]
MSDILSQDEVDALLRGVQSGEIDTESAKEKILSGTRAYDLTSQERIVRGRMPGLEIANERFARFFRNSVSSLIMRYVEVAIHNVEIIKFGEFMKTIPFPSSINIFKMEPLKGYSLLVLEAPLVFAFVDFFFGGKGALHVKSEGRSFTSIEQRVIKKVVTMGLSDMANAWSVLVPINPEQAGSEMNPQFVTIVTPSEIVIKVQINIEVENFTGKLFFCVPYSLIEPIKEKLYSGIQNEKFETDQRWVARLKEILLGSQVEVTAELGSTELTLEELMKLEVGSVVCLDKCVSDNLPLRVEEIEKFSCVPGNSRGNQAVKITKIH